MKRVSDREKEKSMNKKNKWLMVHATKPPSGRGTSAREATMRMIECVMEHMMEQTMEQAGNKVSR